MCTRSAEHPCHRATAQLGGVRRLPFDVRTALERLTRAGRHQAIELVERVVNQQIGAADFGRGFGHADLRGSMFGLARASQYDLAFFGPLDESVESVLGGSQDC